MRRKPLRKVSVQARSNRERRREVVAAARRRDANRCQGARGVPEVRCSGDLQPHEKIRRSQWHDGIYVVENVVMVCDAHHRWVTDCRDLDRARDVGLFAWSWERARYELGGDAVE